MLPFLFLMSIFAISNVNSEWSRGTTEKSEKTETTTANPTTRNKATDYDDCVDLCKYYGDSVCVKECKELIYGHSSTAAPTTEAITTTYSTTTSVPRTERTTTAARTTESTTTSVPRTERTTTAARTTEEITTHVPVTEKATTTARTTESVTTDLPVTEETTTTTSAYNQCVQKCSTVIFKSWCEKLCCL